jgi:acetyl-CoA carboxylase biotin carboxyl carrier protein
MSLSSQEIKEILEILEASTWDEAQVTIGDVTLTVSKSGNGAFEAPVSSAPVAPAGAAAAPAASAPSPPPPPAATPASAAAAAPPETSPLDGGHVVDSPSVGIFWRAPEPGAPPFVEVGDEVEVGATMCIVEVMKLMNYVVADVAGTIRAIHCANGDAVEHATPLFTIEPQG